jgi:hypothetical protein
MGRRLAFAAAAWLLLAAAARPADAEPGDDLTVYALTFGPGDHPFFKFGHNAILVQPRVGEGLVFNFGTFAFDSPALIPKFLRGRLMYWLSVSTANDTLASYQESNRTITAQELDLLPAQRLALYRRLMDNARPDKREYLYDYFWDNCSTRVRDAIDAVVDGRVRAAAQRPASMSLRAHALRMVADLPWEYVALHFGLGSTTDAPITVWQEAFLPDKLHDLLATVRVPREGGERPLVRGERVVFRARRPPTLARPPTTAPGFALVGVTVGGLLALAGARARSSRAARIALGAVASLLGLVLGLLGLVLVLLWTATNHRAAHANANIWQCAPFVLALVVHGVGVARGRSRAIRRGFVVAAAAAVAAAVGVLVKVLPGSTQDNLAFIVLLLPVWVGLALGLRLLTGPLTRRAVRP